MKNKNKKDPELIDLERLEKDLDYLSQKNKMLLKKLVKEHLSDEEIKKALEDE